jgi:hypothetical protein
MTEHRSVTMRADGESVKPRRREEEFQTGVSSGLHFDHDRSG